MMMGLTHIISTRDYKLPAALALALPRQWRDLGPTPFGHSWRDGLTGMVVIASVDAMEDGKEWIHVSCSYPDRLPGWEDLKDVKRLFPGAEATAFQILPPASEYVNLHNNCLHIWAEA